MMQPYRGTKEQWNIFVAANAADGGVLQSWEWGELEKTEGHRVWRLAFEENGTLYACCLLVERMLPFGWKYLYAPRGPVTKIADCRFQIADLLSELEKLARGKGAVFLRLEPPYQQFPISNFQFPIRLVASVQPKQTLRVDLTKSENELLKAMHQKTRYNTRLALKNGVRVENFQFPISNFQFDIFFKLLQTTTARDGFHMHPRVHYETILGTLDAKIFFATRDGQPLATALVVFFGNTAYYLHGASANEHRDVMAPYALHWQIMREAKRRSSTVYDLWGIDEKKWPGVTRFKQGFSPATPLHMYQGTLDVVLSPLRYIFYRIITRQ